MRGFFNGLIFGLILGVLAYWYFDKKARQHPETEQRYESAASEAANSAKETAQHISDALKAKFDTLDLRADEIKDEMAKTGKVVRRKARDLGNQVADAADDARIVTEIKAKYAADSDLSVWKISVSCDQGHVKLSGTVSAPENIAKAIEAALEVNGVQDVTSTLEVKSGG